MVLDVSRLCKATILMTEGQPNKVVTGIAHLRHYSRSVEILNGIYHGPREV